MFLPLIFWNVIWIFVILLYLFYDFSNFTLLKSSSYLNWLTYVFLHIIMYNFGFLTAYMANPYVKKKTVRYLLIPNKNLRSHIKLFFTIGIVFTILRFLYIVKTFGFPKDLHYFFNVRLKYLYGGFNIPPYIDFFSRYFLIYSIIPATIYGFIYRKFIFVLVVLFFVTFNNLLVGGRGDIGFSFVLFFSVYVVLSYGIYRNTISTIRKLVSIRLLILFVFVSFILVYLVKEREGMESWKLALDNLILYFVGNIPATISVILNLIEGKLNSTFGLSTFNAFPRALSILTSFLFGFKLPIPVSYGYVNVYADLGIGMNTYTYIAYLVVDFGVGLSLVFSFLIGVLSFLAFQRLKTKLNLFNFIFAVCMFSLVLTSPLYIATKLISYWIAIVFSLIFLKKYIKFKTLEVTKFRKSKIND